jgi:hypothetical protein
MKKYLISVYEPDGDPPPPEFLEPIMRALDALTEEMKAAGVWLFAGKLHPPSTATVLRANDNDVLVTDGPFTEGKEHLGGFDILQAPDLDSALGWAKRIAQITGLPIEVRPFHNDPGA